jgi:hypothetical protein
VESKEKGRYGRLNKWSKVAFSLPFLT